MEKTLVALLIVLGALNLYPIIGMVSAETLAALYSIEVQQPDLLILLRHRAILFGLLGAFLIYAAFKPALHGWAIAIGLVSMLSFIILAWLTGNYGSGIRKVVLADGIASASLVVVAGLRFWLAKS